MHIARVILVEDAEAVVHIARLVQDAEGLSLGPGVLVHEALPEGVGAHERPEEHAVALRVNHRRPRAVLHLGTGPDGHLLAVAGVHPGGNVHRRLTAVHDGREARRHLLIARDVARCQNDALRSLVAHVIAIGVHANNTRYLTVLHNQLLARRAP